MKLFLDMTVTLIGDREEQIALPSIGGFHSVFGSAKQKKKPGKENLLSLPVFERAHWSQPSDSELGWNYPISCPDLQSFIQA